MGDDAEAAALAADMTEVLDDAQLARLELAEREGTPAPRPRVSAKGLSGSGSRPLSVLGAGRGRIGQDRGRR